MVKINKNLIRNHLYQINALTEKNIKLKLRFKSVLIINAFSPIVSILIPLIVMSYFFKFNSRFGNWTAENFIVYQLIAYNIILIKGIILEFPAQYRVEKFWKTLPALMIAPFNRFYLMLGVFFSQVILISIPFTILIIICYIYYPISALTLLFVIITFFLIMIVFSGMGLVMGVFAISNENMWKVLYFLTDFIFFFSCLTYPFEIFPEFMQIFININPLYYLFDFLRLIWIENNILFSINSHPVHLIILIGSTILLPLIGIYLFNLIYKKYGIVGY